MQILHTIATSEDQNSVLLHIYNAEAISVVLSKFGSNICAVNDSAGAKLPEVIDTAMGHCRCLALLKSFCQFQIYSVSDFLGKETILRPTYTVHRSVCNLIKLAKQFKTKDQ